jgi:hypothetical protein
MITPKQELFGIAGITKVSSPKAVNPSTFQTSLNNFGQK